MTVAPLPWPRRTIAFTLVLALVAACPGPSFYASAAALGSSARTSPARVAVFASLRAAISADSRELDAINSLEGFTDKSPIEGLNPIEREKLESLLAPAPEAAEAAPALPPALLRKIFVELRHSLGSVPAAAMRDPGHREEMLELLEERLPTPRDLQSPIRARAERMIKMVRREASLGYPYGDPARGEREWREHRSQILSESLELVRRVREKAVRREAEIGPEKFKDAMDANEIEEHEDAIGRAEMTRLDDHRVIRVTHTSSQLSLVLVDPEVFESDFRHWRQYLARQHIDSGHSRWDRQEGRDVVLLLHKEGTISEERFVARPKPWSRAWWKAYWFATWKKPDTWKTYAFGFFWATVQFFLAWGVVVAKGYLLSSYVPAIAFHFYFDFPAISVFTFFYGAFFGVFNSTYYNWVYRGRSHLRRMFKGAIYLSFPFALTVTVMDAGLSALTPYAFAGWIATLHLIWNIITNNVGRIAWQLIPQMARNHHVIHGDKANFISNCFYTINWFLRLLDLLVPWWVGVPLFWLGIVAAYRLALRYAEKKKFSESEELRYKWDRAKDRILRLPRRLFSVGRRLIQHG